MELSKQEYWSRLPFPTPEDPPNPVNEATSLVSPASAGMFFTPAPPGRPPIEYLDGLQCFHLSESGIYSHYIFGTTHQISQNISKFSSWNLMRSPRSTPENDPLGALGVHVAV